MKRKKPTRAYKMGFTDGSIRVKGNNTFTQGSTRFVDYERGYTDGLKEKGKC